MIHWIAIGEDRSSVVRLFVIALPRSQRWNSSTTALVEDALQYARYRS